MKDTDMIYKDIIKALAMVELVVGDKNQFNTIRKSLLDIANDIKRLDINTREGGQ